MNHFDKITETNERIKEELKIHTKEKICIVCRKNTIKDLGISPWINPLQQQRGIWEDGIVEVVTPGYGSKYDLSSLLIAICDDCLEERINDGIIENTKQIEKQIQSEGYDLNYIKNLR